MEMRRCSFLEGGNEEPGGGVGGGGVGEDGGVAWRGLVGWENVVEFCIHFAYCDYLRRILEVCIMTTKLL
jgi:hypothetical protein